MARTKKVSIADQILEALDKGDVELAKQLTLKQKEEQAKPAPPTKRKKPAASRAKPVASPNVPRGAVIVEIDSEGDEGDEPEETYFRTPNRNEFATMAKIPGQQIPEDQIKPGPNRFQDDGRDSAPTQHAKAERVFAKVARSPRREPLKYVKVACGKCRRRFTIPETAYLVVEGGSWKCDDCSFSGNA